LITVSFFSSTSMEITTSKVSVRPFVRQQDVLRGVNGDVGRFNFFRYGDSDLISRYKFGYFLMVVARKFILTMFGMYR
jgi:hypothetical protein